MEWSLFIRWREWWFHKIPFCLLIFALIVDDALTWQTFTRLLVLIVIVSAVANYGHAVNELFDRAEDARSEKFNLATRIGPVRMAGTAALSGGLALILSYVFVGIGSTALTACALALPAMYSVPPIRLKARRWWGLLADALAAHVYPATLSVLLATSGAVWPTNIEFLTLVILWSLLTGLRNIILHQLLTEDRDTDSGLNTIIHDLGAERIVRLILIAIIPFEIAALLSLMTVSGAGIVTLSVTVLYAWMEFAQCALGQKRVSFDPTKILVCPFVDNAYYLVWGPLAALAGLASHDPTYAILMPACALLFRQNIVPEWKALKRIRNELLPKITQGAELGDNIGLINNSGAFDAEWYATRYSKIELLGMDPVEHFCRFGWQAGLDPNPNFSTNKYLDSNPDVAAVQMNPLVHYLRHGISEGRPT